MQVSNSVKNVNRSCYRIMLNLFIADTFKSTSWAATVKKKTIELIQPHKKGGGWSLGDEVTYFDTTQTMRQRRPTKMN